MAAQELTFRITANPAAMKSAMAQVRAEINATAQAQKAVGTGELSMRSQLSAAASLQRQRSAAMISEWKRTETAAKQLASGIRPVGTNLQRITDIMQTLGGASSTLAGPLNGVSGRLQSVGRLATEAGGGLGVMGVAAGAAVVGVAALGVGLFVLGKAIFDVANSTAEYAGKLFDLSAQTNFTVETLSALSLAAKTSGGDIDSVAASLSIFQQKMVAAAEGNKEAAKTFRELKIDTTNQEKAIRQAMAALFAMGETEKQSAAAKELFGKSGRVVLGMIKETNGNLDEAIEKYTKMNLLVSSEAAAAADAFSDSLALLNEQLAGVGRTIGFAVIPTLNVFFRNLSDGLANNASEWGSWSRAIAVSFSTVMGLAAAFVQMIVGEIGPAQLLLQAKINQMQFTRQVDQESAVMGVSAIAGRAALMAGSGRRGGRGAAGGGGGKAARDTSLQDAKAEAALVERETLKSTEFDIMENKRALGEQVKDIEAFTERAKELLDEKHDAATVRINAEQAALESAHAKKLITQKEFDIQDRELTLRNDKAERENREDKDQLEHEKDLKVSAAEVAAKQREIQIAEDADARAIKRIEGRIKDEVLAESEGERQIAAIIDEGFKRRRDALTEEETHYSTNLEKRKDINAEIIRLDADRAFSAEEAAKRVIAAQSDEAARAAGMRAGLSLPGSEPFDPFADPPRVDPWIEAFGRLKAIGLDAMHSLAQGVGEMVQNWVMLGTAGPNAVRKMVAGVLGALAAQAAIEALMELARGFAALANPFLAWTAPMHFKAAALFGVVAAGSAIAGRLVAGNAFQSASGGGGGSGSGSSGGGTSAANKDIAPRDIDRRTFNVGPQTIHHELVFKVKGDAVVDSFIQDYELNGRTRIKILTDGRG